MTMMIASSLINGYLGSNATGQWLVNIQLLASVVMVAAAINKWRQFRNARQLFKRIAHDILDNNNDILEYYLARHNNMHSAVENIYTASCERLLKIFSPNTRSLLIGQPAAGTKTGAALTAHEAELVKSRCEHVLEEEENAIEYGMGAVSAVVALAPMLGLLGTVWGVLDAFAEMGAAQTATISQIAPAISAALVTTVVGLLIAIPGVVVYGILSAKKQALLTDLEGFADDLMGRIANEFQGSSKVEEEP